MASEENSVELTNSPTSNDSATNALVQKVTNLKCSAGPSSTTDHHYSTNPPAPTRQFSRKGLFKRHTEDRLNMEDVDKITEQLFSDTSGVMSSSITSGCEIDDEIPIAQIEERKHLVDRQISQDHISSGC